ncbi:hypothetical protein AB6A40_010893, partial [Gnathostoma spinigerum]
MDDEMTDIDSSEPICGEFEDCTLLRFTFLMCASVISVFGALSNLLLVFIFVTQKRLST